MSECHDLGGLVSAVEDDRPVFLIENKLMYGRPNRRPEDGHVGELAVRETGDRYPALTFSGTDFTEASATIVTYGGMLLVVLDAVIELILEHEIFCEVVSLAAPAAGARGCARVRRANGSARHRRGGHAHGRLRRGDRGPRPGGRLERPARARPLRRGARRDHPSARPLEDAMLPSAHDVVEAIAALEACEASRLMLEIVLTREDANTELALLAEWLVEDRAEVEQGSLSASSRRRRRRSRSRLRAPARSSSSTRKASRASSGSVVARIAETAQGAASLDAGGRLRSAPQPSEGERKATRKAVELAERHGVDSQ